MKAKSKKLQDSVKNKLQTESILIMDIASLPRDMGLDVEKWAHIIKEQGILFYDSKKGNAPFYSKPNPDIKMYDVKEESAMSELESILEGEDLLYSKKVVPKKIIDPTPSITAIDNSGEIYVDGATEFENNITVTTTNSENLFQEINNLTQEINNGTTEVQVEALSPVITNISVAPPLETYTSEVDAYEPQSAGPLTTEEVGQLEVEDPRGNAARLSNTENTLIDEVMNRPPAIEGGSFNLIDDTE